MAVGNRFNGTGNGRLLLKEKPFGECTHQLSLPATSDFCPNHAPVAADSVAGREGVRSTTMGESRKRTEESLLSSGRLGFFLPRGGQGHSQFYSIDFHVTHRFFVTFFTEESNVSPRIPSPAYALCCFSMPSLSAISAMNSPLVGLSSGMATRQPNARFSDSTRPRLQATSMAWRMARSTLLGLVA